MEWVETTAKSVDEAKDLLLDQLGVDDQEAEFDVLEEPRPGMFGRSRGVARVRARIAPKAPRQKEERRRRSSKEGGRSPAAKKTAAPAAPASDVGDAEVEESADRASRPPRAPRRAPERQAPAADPDAPALSVEDAVTDVTAFLGEFLGRMDVTATTAIEISDEGELMVSIQGDQLGRLIGPRGGTLTAIEELCRTRLQHRAAGGERPRLRLDVAGYREARRENLRSLVATTVDGVRSSGNPHVIDVVTAGERKLIHDYVAEHAADLATSSEGEDPVRRVVISPA